MSFEDCLTQTCTIEEYTAPAKSVRGGDKPTYTTRLDGNGVPIVYDCRVVAKGASELDERGKRIVRTIYKVYFVGGTRLTDLDRIVTTDPSSGATLRLAVQAAYDPTGVDLEYVAICERVAF